MPTKEEIMKWHNATPVFHELSDIRYVKVCDVYAAMETYAQQQVQLALQLELKAKNERIAELEEALRSMIELFGKVVIQFPPMKDEETYLNAQLVLTTKP